MAEHAAEPLDDRQAEAKAARRPRALLEPLEFFEHQPLLVGGNAKAGVPHFDPHLVADEASAADDDAALRRVFERVGDEVLQQAAHQPPVRAHDHRRSLETQRQSLGARGRRELDLELAKHVGDREIDDLRPRRAGVEA